MEDLENEVWRPIYNYPNYQISNLGRVKSLIKHNGTSERILKPQMDKDGYLTIGLYNNGKFKNHMVHRLVASAFIPNDDLFKVQINHKDENKQNNVWTNLEWCDCQYNINYGTHNERMVETARRKGCFKTIGKILSKINIETKSKQVSQYNLEGKLIEKYKSSREASRHTGFAQSSISDCCRGKLKTAYGYVWKYTE